MEFTEYKCPVCDEQFKSGDDVVVCPECGAPHHRACYEKSEHCFYEDKHSDDFSYEELNNKENFENSDGEFIICPKCKHENEKTMFYCDKCGYPLSERDRINFEKQNTQQNNQQNGTQFNQGTPPFGFGTPVMNAFDPLAGLKSDDEIADNVKVGEMAKFVGKSTQYFLTVFNRIKSKNGTRFNFSAFVFSGFYFLYRKMYGLGTLISLILIGLTVGETLIMMIPEYQDIYNAFYEMYSSSMFLSSVSMTSQFTLQEFAFLLLPSFLFMMRIGIMLLCGFKANRVYYKHCTKKINAVKSKSNGTDINKELESNGGVNIAIAISFYVAYIIIMYIPYFL